MDCTILIAKTKALISFAVTAKLICVFVFACAKSLFSHNEAHYIHTAKMVTKVFLVLIVQYDCLVSTAENVSPLVSLCI